MSEPSDAKNDATKETMMAQRKSDDLWPGARLCHTSGTVVTLDRRKRPDDELHALPYHPGWWLRDNAGGLADFVIDDPESDWSLLSERPRG